MWISHGAESKNAKQIKKNHKEFGVFLSIVQEEQKPNLAQHY